MDKSLAPYSPTSALHHFQYSVLSIDVTSRNLLQISPFKRTLKEKNGKTEMEDSNQILFHCLLESQAFSCEYGNALSNHLPMALIALQRIGATADQLKSFHSRYSSILEKVCEDPLVIDSLNWRQFLGLHQHNLPYRLFFLQELREKGTQFALETYLPLLMEGVSGGAFHPLIRLAYGIEVKSEWEIAESLASWCMAFQQLGSFTILESITPSMSLFEHLKLLTDEIQKNPVSIKGDSVFSSLKSAAESQAFHKFASHMPALDLSVSQIAGESLKIYLTTNDNFTALHCITATHAMRIIAPYLKDATLTRFLWQSICAACVAIQCLPLKESLASSPPPTWNEIFNVAAEQTNDHVAKFVYTCHSEFKTYHNPLYQIAAAKKTHKKF